MSPAIDYDAPDALYAQRPIDAYSSAAGTNADYEGQLRRLRIQNAIDEETKRSREINADPDPMTEQILARQKQNAYERLLPAGSTSRLAIDAPDDTGPDSRGATAIDRVLGDPEFKGQINVGAARRGRAAIDQTEPMGGYTTGEEVQTGLERQKYFPKLQEQGMKNQGAIDERLAPSREVDPLIQAKYEPSFRAIDNAKEPDAIKVRAREILRQRMLDEQIEFRKLGQTHRPEDAMTMMLKQGQQAQQGQATIPPGR